MKSLIGRDHERRALDAFVGSDVPRTTLGLVWGRRRIGKSMLLGALARDTGGFYYQAVRGSSGEALQHLGEMVSAHLGLSVPLAFRDWEHAVETLLGLGRERPTVVVLDEFPYLLEHTPALDSIIQRLLGPDHPSSAGNRTRLILCGSAITVMSRLLSGSAPLRGRAGLDLRMMPFDFRRSRTLHDLDDLPTALATYAVIGGVAAYARDMVQDDLPASAADFDRWVCERVLSPAAPLFGEIELLLAEDPSASKTRKINLYHSVLAGIAQGHHTAGALSKYTKITGAGLSPLLDALVSMDLIARVQDPARDNRPRYHPNDSLLRFHYAITRRQQARLARFDTDRTGVWHSVQPTFRSLVLGPCFEGLAREWTLHRASERTLGGIPELVGSTVLSEGGVTTQEIDVVVAAGDGAPPNARRIVALGEAKVGERLTVAHVRALEEGRRALGSRATDAKLLLFGAHFDAELRAQAARRTDVELVDLERLYHGE